MPRVPSYDTAQVQQQPTGPIRLQALAPDTDSIAQGIGSFQRGAEILAAKERERADTALLKVACGGTNPMNTPPSSTGMSGGESALKRPESAGVED